jgi:CubicO group peptidase (beta-lactamase class C family)
MGEATGVTEPVPVADDLGALIRARLRADGVPGLSAALVTGDRVRWVRGFGVADLASGAPVGAETVFLWFSMTKIVTATAVLRLVERGAIDLDSPVDEVFPPFTVVRQPRPVTVRHLLSHSSGLANPVPVRWVHAADAAGPDSQTFVERLLATSGSRPHSPRCCERCCPGA